METFSFLSVATWSLNHLLSALFADFYVFNYAFFNFAGIPIYLAGLRLSDLIKFLICLTVTLLPTPTFLQHFIFCVSSDCSEWDPILQATKITVNETIPNFLRVDLVSNFCTLCVNPMGQGVRTF